ncbi:MAG: phosphotransferase [Chloroflexi bacterium]|nr:phosphotransferase [Chloroflexota bacterium]
MLSLPAAFATRVRDVHGERGRTWLAELPRLLEKCRNRWSLAVDPPVANLSYNFIAPARLIDGTEAILKLGVPHREFSCQIEALRLFDGRGAVRLIDADPDVGAMLLERAVPGDPLWDMGDEEAAPIVARVMKELWRPAPDVQSLPTLADWVRRFDRLRARFNGSTGPLPEPMVRKAERLFDELGADRAPVLLHGDLHHGNVLSARRAPWLAIDPKGVVGPREFEVGAFMRNPLHAVMSSPDPARRLGRRIALLSEHLGFPKQVVRDWAFV